MVTKYEYKLLFVRPPDLMGDPLELDAAAYEATINVLAEDGFRLVHVVAREGGTLFVFEREVVAEQSGQSPKATESI